MEPKHLYTIQWTQPYATYQQRPYLRNLQEQLERTVEQWLVDEPDYADAKKELKRIMSL
jgi:hypothetical protein